MQYDFAQLRNTPLILVGAIMFISARSSVNYLLSSLR